jgi:hypothetical protein
MEGGFQSISELIVALTEYVAQTSSEHFDNEEYIKKVKSLLPPIINSSLNLERVTIGEIRTILTLLLGLSQKSPQVFSDETLGRLVLKLIPFLSTTKFRAVHSSMIQCCTSLLLLLCGFNSIAFRSFFQDCLNLLEGNCCCFFFIDLHILRVTDLLDLQEYYQMEGEKQELKEMHCFQLFSKHFSLVSDNSNGNKEMLTLEFHCRRKGKEDRIERTKESIERLSANILEIVNVLSKRVGDAVSDLLLPLSATLSSYLQTENPTLIAGALQVTHSLLCLYDLPPQVSHAFLYSLIALLSTSPLAYKYLSL